MGKGFSVVSAGFVLNALLVTGVPKARGKMQMLAECHWPTRFTSARDLGDGGNVRDFGAHADFQMQGPRGICGPQWRDGGFT